MRTATLRRLEQVEAAVRQEHQRRLDEAIGLLRETMSAAHRRRASDELHEAGMRLGAAYPGETVAAMSARVGLSAFARAICSMLMEHLVSGAPVAMPPDVAEVYLSDPDAFPGRSCVGCQYLMPTRSIVLPDGHYRHVATYEGACPVCGRDTREDEDGREAAPA